MFRHWVGIERKLFVEKGLGLPGAIQDPGTEDTFLFLSTSEPNSHHSLTQTLEAIPVKVMKKNHIVPEVIKM